MKNYSLVFVFLVLLFVSCGRKKTIVVEPAFYMWSSGGYYDVREAVEEMNVHKFYHKVFEVDYNEVRGNFPIAKNNPSQYDFEKGTNEIIPTVFVKNEVLKHNDHKSLDELADNIVYLISKYIDPLIVENKEKEKIIYNEIQIDCDWTKSTKDNYFYLLRKIKELSKKKISCTLRLYPYAYPEIMGVPPVDRVMLMCYNLISPLDNPNKNSILDVAELEKYLKGKKKYPLKLDVALPVFSWTQLYQNNRFSALLNLTSKDIETVSEKTDEFWYTITKDTTINWDLKLRMGDRIKCEEVQLADLKKAVALIKKHVPLDGNVTISLFDLQSSVFKKYSHEELSDLYTSFSK